MQKQVKPTSAFCGPDPTKGFCLYEWDLGMSVSESYGVGFSVLFAEKCDKMVPFLLLGWVWFLLYKITEALQLQI